MKRVYRKLSRSADRRIVRTKFALNSAPHGTRSMVVYSLWERRFSSYRLGIVLNVMNISCYLFSFAREKVTSPSIFLSLVGEGRGDLGDFLRTKRVNIWSACTTSLARARVALSACVLSAPTELFIMSRHSHGTTCRTTKLYHKTASCLVSVLVLPRLSAPLVNLERKRHEMQRLVALRFQNPR